MKENNPFQRTFIFFNHSSKKRKIQILLLFVLMFFNSFLEMISIGAVFPFIAVLTNPDLIFENKSLVIITNFLNIKHDHNLKLIFTVTFALLVLFSCSGRLLLLYCLTRMSFMIGSDTCQKIYSNVLFQTYSYHIKKNSSSVINGIHNQAETVVFSVVMAFLTFSNNLLVLIGVTTILLVINFYATLMCITFFMTLYAIIILLSRKKLTESGIKVASTGQKIVQTLQESLGAIREILIDGSQNVFVKIFRSQDLLYKRSQGNIVIITAYPKFIIEAVGIIGLSIAAYIAAKNEEGILEFLPLIGVLALGAQRILPLLNEVYKNWSTIRGIQASLIDVLILLDLKTTLRQNQLNKVKLPFNSTIKLKNISFSYSVNEDKVFESLNYTIPKNKKIGIIGPTGIGKSTLVDLLMGLLTPDKGSVYIDNIKLNSSNISKWQKKIAHVPQRIFLIDGDISENIAFGIEKNKIDYNKIEEVIKAAKLDDFISCLKNGYKTGVGELGVKLSGGEKQRIGIARALYKNAEIIVFDEATSALDTKTEKFIINNIYNLNKNLTLFFIAHRIQTLSDCDEIIEIGNKKIIKKMSFKELISSV